MPGKEIDMESALVGALILSPEEYGAVAAIVKIDDFSQERARAAFEAIRFLSSEGKPIDPVLITEELRHQGRLEAVGGILGLASLSDAATSGANAKYYAENVARQARERRIRDAIAKAGVALADGADVDAVCGELRADLKEAENSDMRRLSARPIFDIAMEQLDPAKKRDLVSTGYKYLDACHGGGIARGSLTIVGAAPSVGKTQFVINLIPALEYQGNPARVLHVSMEMDEVSMSQRLVAVMGGLHIRTAQQFFQATANKGTRDEYGSRFERGMRAMKALPMRMITGSFTPDELRAIAFRYSGRFDVMVIDYVQRCKGEKGQQTRERVEAATRACKDIAMEHDAAVVAIASLNRDGYKEGGSKPDMQHLRESGNIEFDADNIWMLWREKDSKVSVEEMELYIRKQRNGPLATVVYDFELPTGTISEKPQEQQPFF
jgi:replicative DNA helicase